MKNVMVYVISIFILLVVPLVSAGSVDSRLTENKRSIIIQPSQPQFSIKLESNPTTGFSWSLKKYNKKYIHLVSHQYIKPSTNLMGSAGYETWVFKANKNFFNTSKTIISLKYARPWESHGESKTVIYQILSDKPSHGIMKSYDPTHDK